MKLRLHINDLKIATVLLIVLANLFLQKLAGQDLHFSQFSEAPLLRNPSLAGIYKGDIRVQAVQRNQWNSVTVPYKTTSLNAETKLALTNRGDDFITLGIQVLADKAGTTNFKSVHALPVINYHKSLSADYNRYLSLGFMGGIVNRSIDRSKITTNNQWGSGGFDPSLPDGETFATSGYTFWDASVGLSYNSNIGENEDNNYFLGVALHHFNKPKVGFYEADKKILDAKIVASGGLRFHFGEESYITLQADHSKQGNNSETIGGLLYTMNLVNGIRELKYAIHAGAYLRWKDAIIPVVRLDYNPFSISLSYDINTSSLKPASRGQGGFELSLSLLAFKQKSNSSSEAVRCPKF
jgi:type IX secretion system PorP/SprF family membrane protein